MLVTSSLIFFYTWNEYISSISLVHKHDPEETNILRARMDFLSSSWERTMATQQTCDSTVNVYFDPIFILHFNGPHRNIYYLAKQSKHSKDKVTLY